MVEAHFGIPMRGAVLNTLNTRLDAETLAFMLDHGEAKVVIIDREFSRVMREALAAVDIRPLVIDVDDAEYSGPGERIGEHRLREPSRAAAIRQFAWSPPSDEWDAICAELHLGHDRQSERRRLSPSRRLPERGQQHPRMGHAEARGLSVDAADVPLQRLVLPVDRGRARGRQRVPAPRRRADHLRC